ncbi:MAG: hypothetical protein HKN76_03715 [Saprospiraceae bacterium]|nr:hypothetical protein [Saprospiraceae bacterium]
MITFLHTAKANIQRFEDLVQKHAPGTKVQHYVNEELLKYAIENGHADTEAFKLEADQIMAATNGTIVCTCSSYGEACDQFSGIERIDRPVVEYLVDRYEQIGLAYTAKSTLAMSRNLIEAVAKNKGKRVEVIEIDCSHCWPYFIAGDADRYVKEIARHIKNNPTPAEAIFLAQASMENSKMYLDNYPIEVMASPEYGVITYLQR